MSDPNMPPPPPGGGTPPPPGGQPPSAPPPGPPTGGVPPAPGSGVPPAPGSGVPPAPGGGGGGYVPPPAQPYGGGYGGPQQLDVGAAFSYGWQKFQQYAKEFILLVLGVFVAVVVVSLVAFMVMVPAISGDSAVLGLIGWAIAFALVFVVSFAVQAGVYRASLAVTQGRAPAVSMFTDSTNLGPFILTVIVVGLGAAIGYMLCILPGIAWIFFTAYAPLRAIDRGEGPGDAIKGSIDMVRENIGPVLLVLLVAYLVYYVGALVCYVGLLVSIPVALTMIAYSYRVINGEPVAP